MAKREVISNKVVAGWLPARCAECWVAGFVALLPLAEGQCDVVPQT